MEKDVSVRGREESGERRARGRRRCIGGRGGVSKVLSMSMIYKALG